MPPETVLGLLLVGATSTASITAALATWLRTAPPGPVPEATVTLVIPVTGRGVDLRRLCRALAAQTLKPSTLAFVVESLRDPAHARLLEAGEASGLAFRVVVAGPAAHASQKCHNLSAALAELDDGVAIVVLADADIVPQAGWLADLVRPVATGRAACVTGYRWALPVDTRAGTLLAAWTDRAIASMPKFRWQVMAWAGSFAFAPGLLKRLDAARILAHAVSDDMTLAAAAAAGGSPALYRLRVLVPSPVSHSVGSFLGFATRQYQMLMLHQPRVWATALATVGSLFAIRSGLWIAAAISPFWLRVLAAFLAANWIAYGLRLWRARYLGCWPIRSRAAEWLLPLVALFGPLVDAVHLFAILRGARTRRIDWSHLSYTLERGRVTAIERRDWT